MEIKEKENISKEQNSYEKLSIRKDLLMIENASLDFMVLTEATFDDFRKLILSFQANVANLKGFKLLNHWISLSPLGNNSLKTTKLPEFIFSKKINREKFMMQWINSILENGHPIELIDGLIIYKNNNVYESYFR